MSPSHILLALLVAVIWGINFTIIRIGLGSFPPILLVAIRFVVVALPVFLFPRPNISWKRFFALGIFLFLGQFTFLFTSMSVGMPAGVASILMQSQVFLTILIAAVFLKEMPTRIQVIGMVIACLGLFIISETVGGADFTLLGLLLCLTAAAFWATGNVLLRGIGKVDMLALVTWLSLIPPIPLFALSYVLEGPDAIAGAFSSIDWVSIGVILYLAFLSTTVCYAIWSRLLAQYSAATVVPFALLVPIFGMGSAMIFLGEQFGPLRLTGMALVFVGLVIAVLPVKHFRKLLAKY
ncbi:EamA family transporter [Microvirga sp. W0021]|uniref:EamA family transporter n=1 Tax=Hohaiivirga grylli TaxID=3133970 RepID=A0ABV0BJS0_9HYPH